MKPLIFDVDGVLCDRGQIINSDFQNFLLNYLSDKNYYLITGGDKESTINKIGIDLVNKADIGFYCLGNHINMDGQNFYINKIELKPEEIEFLTSFITNSNFQYKTGNNFSQRKGSVNFSVIGSNATIEQRQAYVEYDKNVKERIIIIKQLMTRFPRLEAFIGGDVSIDICLRGAHKGHVGMFIPGGYHDTYFFTDRWNESNREVDFPFAKMVLPSQVMKITDGYKQTWEILKTL